MSAFIIAITPGANCSPRLQLDRLRDFPALRRTS